MVKDIPQFVQGFWIVVFAGLSIVSDSCHWFFLDAEAVLVEVSKIVICLVLGRILQYDLLQVIVRLRLRLLIVVDGRILQKVVHVEEFGVHVALARSLLKQLLRLGQVLGHSSSLLIAEAQIENALRVVVGLALFEPVGRLLLSLLVLLRAV